MSPSDVDFQSREGYGANKVAAEQVLLDSGSPVTVLRASKVHGPGATRPCEWVFVKRILDRRPAVLLAHRGTGIDHMTAAANIASLIGVVAAAPGRRILNCADPEALNAVEISRVIAAQLGHTWEEVVLDETADETLGLHPWDRPYPVVLDITAALDLGYVPVGDYATTVADEVAWLVSLAWGNSNEARLPFDIDTTYFDPMFDYAAEDRYLAARCV